MQSIEQRTKEVVDRLDRAARAGEILLFLYILASTVVPGFEKGPGYIVIGLIVGIVAGVLVSYLLRICFDWMKQVLIIQVCLMKIGPHAD